MALLALTTLVVHLENGNPGLYVERTDLGAIRGESAEVSQDARLT